MQEPTNIPGQLSRAFSQACSKFIRFQCCVYTRIELPVRATPNQEMRSKFFLCQKRQISGRTDYLIVVDRKKRAKFRLRDNKFKKLFLSFVLSLSLFSFFLYFLIKLFWADTKSFEKNKNSGFRVESQNGLVFNRKFTKQYQLYIYDQELILHLSLKFITFMLNYIVTFIV